MKTTEPAPAIRAADYGGDHRWLDYLAAQDRGDAAALEQHRRHHAAALWMRAVAQHRRELEDAAADARAALQRARDAMESPQQLADLADALAAAQRRVAGFAELERLPGVGPVEPLHRELLAGCSQRRWVTGVWAIGHVREAQRCAEDGEPWDGPDGVTFELLERAAEPARAARRELADVNAAVAGLEGRTDRESGYRRQELAHRIAVLEARLAGETPPPPLPSDPNVVNSGRLLDRRPSALV